MSQPKGLVEGIYSGSAPWATLVVTFVTVSTSATALPASALTNRKGLWLSNPGTVTVFLGSSGVGTTNDLRLFGGVILPLSVSDQVTIYGIVASGTQVVTVWEFTTY